MVVLQGSILGPLLFSLFVNDLPSVLTRCQVVMYADDTTVYFSDGDASKIEEVLENELNALAGWISTNGLRLNAKKPQVMILSR